VQGTARLKNTPSGTLAAVAFYAATGAIFLILLPFANYPPHVGLMGVMSLITAYALFTKRSWTKWLVAAMFFVVTTMSLVTVYFILLSNGLLSVGMLAYAVLAWYFTYYVFIKKL
jgi:hypothetical protein